MRKSNKYSQKSSASIQIKLGQRVWQSPGNRPTVWVLIATVCAMALFSNSVMAQSTWTGGGTDANWSTSANWSALPVSPASLVFAGNTRPDNTNDILNLTASSITFDSAAGAFALSGNALSLSGNINFNGNPATSITQTINLPLSTTADITIGTPANGNLALNGNLNSGNNVVKLGSGTLTFGGLNSIQNLDINGGTNVITGDTTIIGNGVGYDRIYLADGDSIANCNGTLVIQPGADFSVTGNFNDAMVIGRDSGSGEVIQNGGLFNFAPGNQTYLFVGAANNSATHAAYDMNGGVLNMNGNTLGIALGAGAVITGMVNQASGVITNVGNLYFDPFFTAGYGIYNLTGGTIYIGAGGITVYSGGKYEVNLGGGTVAAGAGWSSALNMTLTGINGPTTFNTSGFDISLSGVISGPGGMNIAGFGILDLSGANTYQGDTLVEAGATLRLNSTGSSSGAMRLANGGDLNLNFTGNYAVGSFYTNGVALPVGLYSAANMPGFISGLGTLQVSSGISTGHWTGLGADNNWSTAGNWDNNAKPIFPIALTFGGMSGLTNNNDLSGISIVSLTFSNTAGAFSLDGNSVNLSGNIGFTGNPASPITQTINLPMTWTASENIDTPTNGNLTLGGGITSTTDTSLYKLDAGLLALNGTNSIQSWDLNGGTTVIGGITTLNGGGNSRVYIGDGDNVSNCSGTLVIQPGATLTMSGTFADAFVIGRDGGSGALIQNGGTFTYASNQGFLFVGATSKTNTSAAYDMNGGVLNMGGNTLAVGLGDAGVVYTASLNQTNGNINGVFKLDLGAVRSFGRGVFNLSGGSITIDLGGIVSDDGSYAVNLGGGSVAASSSWASSLNMTLTGSNGPVTFNTLGNTITLSGILSGPGGLVVSGGGILELSGANTYLGDTFVTSGFLQLDSTGSSLGNMRVANGALLNLNFTGNFVVPALYTNNVALPLGTYNAGNLPGFITGGGNIQVVGAVSTGQWTGLGNNSNWSTPGNWDKNAVPIFPIALTFGGNAGLNNSNDLSGVTVSGMTFGSSAGAFTLGGNGINLNGNLGFNGNPLAPITQTINMNLTNTVDMSIDTPTNGNLVLVGNFTSGNNVTKLDAGTLTLGGVNTIQNMDINGGTNIITGNTMINGNGIGYDRIYIADGDSIPGSYAALIIQSGATFDVTGNFNDAMVIGRDGGSGTVVQNGGVFNFAPANQTYLFVGASGNSKTYSEYDMNGGVLNMNGNNLGIALGANAVITSVLNQAGGVITNLGTLYLDPFFTQGHGIYNLTGGTLYLGSGGITVFAGGGYAVNLGGGSLVASSSWSSSLNMNLTGINGSVSFNPSGNAINLSGVLSGTGGLILGGSGTLELSGANDYTGNTTVSAGTLKLDSANTASKAFVLSEGATLNLNYSGTMPVGALSTNGVALAVGTYNSSNLPSYIIGTGAIQVVGTIPTAPTKINFTVSNGHINISWPADYQGWILQQQTNSLSVGIGTNWVDVAGTTSVTSTNIPMPSGAPAAFYRLRYPTP